MRAHPIPPVTEPLQFRAIGLVRGTYTPTDLDQVTRGVLTDSNGLELETVVLGRVLTCLLYTSPSPRDRQKSRMPSSA